MKRAAAAVCACCLTAAAQAAAARAAPIPLPSPNVFGPPPPPLTGGPANSPEPGEIRVPGTLSSAEAVRVGVGQDGSPVSIVVLHRMSIRGLGDFRFVVPAPAKDVAPAAGSQSFPGLRQSGIVWQGFSPGRRSLGARITLVPSAASAGLPLRISIGRAGGFTRVRLQNRTANQFALTLGSAPLPALQEALARLRDGLGRQLAAGRPLPLASQEVEGTAGKQRLVSIDAPLRVTGTISVTGGRAAKVDTTIGGDRPRVHVVALRGEGRVRVKLQATFARDRRTFLPTASELAAAHDPLVALETGIARAAVALQYQQYLASPDPGGASTTSYRYRTAHVVAAPPSTTGGGTSGGGISALLIALIVVAGLVGLGGLTVLWAHM